MDLKGLAVCSRYAYPPNSLSLCGPDKKKDLSWYTNTLQIDSGTVEILSQFSTLYPYLKLIAEYNLIKDPFDIRVVEAYWLGNSLLNNIPVKGFSKHLKDALDLKRKLNSNNLEQILEKIGKGALPHHAFHVLGIYKRTGNIDSYHTVSTINACLINWGKVISINKNSLVVQTSQLDIIRDKLAYSDPRTCSIMPQGENDVLFQKIKTGDNVTYHWGYFCQKINNSQLRNLVYYNSSSLKLANSSQI